MTVIRRSLVICFTALIISGCVSRGSYEKLEAELNEVRALLVKRDASLKDLEGEAAALREDLQLREKMIEESKTENETLAEQVRKRTVELNDLQQRYDAAQQKIDGLNEEVQKQQNAAESLAAGEAELKKRAEGLQIQADLRSDTIYQLMNQLEAGRNELQVRTAGLEEQAEGLSKRLDEALLEKAELDEALKSERVTSSLMTEELENLEREHSAKLHDLQQRYDAAQQKIDGLNEEVQKQQAAAESLAAGEAELKKRAAGLQIQADLRSDTIYRLMNQLEAGRNELQTSLKGAEAEMSVLKEKIAERDTFLAGMKKESLELSNRLNDTQLEINRLAEETGIKTSRIEQLEEKLEQCSTQLTDANMSLTEMIDAEKMLQEQVGAAREALESLTSEKSEASERIEQLREHMNARERNLEQVRTRLASEEKMRKEVEDSMRRMERTYAELVDQFKVEMGSKEATIENLRKKLTVTFVQDILFRTGETAISSDGKKMLKKIGSVLKHNGSDKIVVRGHSDTVPIAKEYRGRFPSNWELSAARAAAVVRYFQHVAGINPRRMEAVGASFYQPVAGNDTPEDRARNRRVEIFITPNGEG